MKATAIALLILLCLGLGFVLVNQKKTAAKLQEQTRKELSSVSNELDKASSEKTELMKVNTVLETNLALRIEEVLTLSNELSVASTKLAKTESEFRINRQTYLEDLDKRDRRITELETQRDDLGKRVQEVSISLATLEAKIADTEKKLASSEGDRSFLLAELKRLQEDKKVLEKQLNDLNFLRDQVRKLRNELAASKRLDWWRKGVYDKFNKSAGELQRALVTPPPVQTNFSLKVDIRQDGNVKVVPNTNAPVAPPAATNRPAARPPAK